MRLDRPPILIWPIHPDGTPKAFGEMPLGQQEVFLQAAAELFAAEQERLAVILAGRSVRN